MCRLPECFSSGPVVFATAPGFVARFLLPRAQTQRVRPSTLVTRGSSFYFVLPPLPHSLPGGIRVIRRSPTLRCRTAARVFRFKDVFFTLYFVRDVSITCVLSFSAYIVAPSPPHPLAVLLFSSVHVCPLPPSPCWGYGGSFSFCRFQTPHGKKLPFSIFGVSSLGFVASQGSGVRVGHADPHLRLVLLIVVRGTGFSSNTRFFAYTAHHGGLALYRSGRPVKAQDLRTR